MKQELLHSVLKTKLFELLTARIQVRQVLELILLAMCRWPLGAPYPIIVHPVANYRPHLSHFWASV